METIESGEILARLGQTPDRDSKRNHLITKRLLARGYCDYQRDRRAKRQIMKAVKGGKTYETG